MNEIGITWSLMHPTPLDVAYFRRVLAAADRAGVDDFEICGDCHGTRSGLDGLYDYTEYPGIADAAHREAVAENRRRLNTILRLAHASGKAVCFWHREVVVPPGLVDAVPELLDDNGEFDFFGAPFAELTRRKIRGAFGACPEMDALVLTLTEAHYSVIHPADPVRYPAPSVVEHIARLYKDELDALGKRFVLRSFGSTRGDYETILEGAAKAAKKGGFEIETKVTPYDFIPSFRDNPFLRRTPGCSLGAELDGLGEFLGAGYFPAAGIDDMLERIDQARAAGAARFAIRLDRKGNSLLDTAYAAKLGIFEAAAREGSAAGRERLQAWLRETAPGNEATLRDLFATGWEATLKTLFVGGNVVCHTNPVSPRLKWLKAGGFFGFLHGAEDLSRLRDIWSVQADRPGLSRAEILAEKNEAVRLAELGSENLTALAPALPEGFRSTLQREWNNLGLVARAMRRFIGFSLDALEGLQALDDRSESLREQLRAFRTRFDIPDLADAATDDAETIETDLFAPDTSPVETIWVAPLAALMARIIEEYVIELRMRRELADTPGAVDFMVPGGIADDWRVGRHMHASHAALRDGRIVREVGNKLFPDGHVDLFPRLPQDGALVRLRAEGPAPPQIAFGGRTRESSETAPGFHEIRLPAGETVPGEPVRVRRGGPGNLAVISLTVHHER